MAAPIVYESICDKFNISSLSDHQKKAIDSLMNGNDVFVGTKTGSGKSMTYESFPLVKPGSKVLVIAPLVSIMSEQCQKLNSLGFNATYIGKDPTENDKIEKGAYDFVFGSPEALVGENKWRDMLRTVVYQDRLSLIVVDEAHTVIQWYKGEGTGKEDPFRHWFSKIGELRSLCPNATMAALTATSGPTQRRNIMKHLCFRANATIVLDSVDRENIKISSVCIPNNDKLEETFQWLIKSLKEQQLKTERHIIFCETISTVSKIFAAFVKELGHENKMFEMFHSKTKDNVKEKIRHDMMVDGKIRVLICTNAAGMGVNFFGVSNIVHYSLPRQMDTFVQQMGRAGRDGKMSDELIFYKNNKTHLKKIDNEMLRLARDDTTCRHEMICSAYLIAHRKITPIHNCCDVCAKKCQCENEQCPRAHAALAVNTEETDDSSEDHEMCRNVSESEQKLLRQKLIAYKYSLQSASLILDSDVVHGLTDEVVSNIVSNCKSIFTVEDVVKQFPIWSFKIAVDITNIVCDVFGDADMYNLLEDTEDYDSDDV